MAPTEERVVYINGRAFRDVTNQTVEGPTYTYEEAKALTEGRRITVRYTANGQKLGEQ